MEFLVTVEMGAGVGQREGDPEFVARYDTGGQVDTMAGGSGSPDYWTGPDEAGPPGASAWVLDGLTMRWAMESYPAQPEPVVTTFRLLAETPDALPPLEVGTLVYVSVQAYAPDPYYSEQVPVATFYGRLSDARGRPVTFNGAPHLEVEVTATSHEADWAEVYIGAQPFPEEAGYDRMERILAAAGLPGVGGGGTQILRTLDVDHRSFMDVAEETLSQQAQTNFFPTGQDFGYHRPIIYPQLVTDYDTGLVLDDPHVSVVDLVERRGGCPRVFVWVDGVLVTMADDRTSGPSVQGIGGAATVSAAYCAMGLEWRRDKSVLPNRVDVAGDYAAYASYLSGEIESASTLVRVQEDAQVAARGPITRRMESTLKYAFSARAMARMYLPDEADFVGRWAAPQVTIYADALPDTEAAEALFRDPPLFPFHGITGFFSTGGGFPYGKTFHAHGLQAEHRLAGDSYVAGSIIGADLAINASAPRNRRVLVTVSLSPTVGRYVRTYGGEDFVPDFTVAGAGDSWAINPRAMAARFPTATPANVDPALTYYDLRLVRSKIGVL